MSNSPQAAAAALRAGQVPRTLDQAQDPVWLTQALTPVTGGAAITDVQIVEVLRTMATKVRFTASWDGPERSGGAFCLKAFLDVDAESARGAAVTITEADFYAKIAPSLSVRVPSCVAHIVDRAGGQGVIIMRDLIADGARFCTALEPLDLSQASASLDQLARLHAASAILRHAPWIGHRVSDFANAQFLPQATLQALLDGPRGAGLEPDVRDAGRLMAGLKALASHDERQPQTLIHGDCHAGNLFQTPAGPGLIDWQLLQRGNWALDVAYHIAAVLPVEVAAREEWNLLRDYLDRARGYGCETPSFEAARQQYRAAVVWGYYLWAITRRVEPAVIETFVNRLGSAVTRHESYRLLEV
jgi:aminoglycoside phosphotransferase (APT) family kinase protein